MCNIFYFVANKRGSQEARRRNDRVNETGRTKYESVEF